MDKKVTSIKEIKSILLLALLLNALFLSAQTTVNDVRVEFKLDEESSTLIPDVLFKINVSDTAQIDKIIITLGTTSGGSEYFSYTINANGSNLPQGLTLNVSANSIIINTGSRSGVVQYHGSAKLLYRDGTYSPLKTVTNIQ